MRLAHHTKNFNVKTLTFANANADAGGSTIALPGLRPGELKTSRTSDSFRLR